MNETAFFLRPGLLRDLPALAAAERACFPDPWGEGGLRAHLAGGAARTVVCEAAGETAGYLLGCVIPPEAEVFRIAALPSARRRGVGRALLGHFLGECRARGCTDVYLEVRASNAPAIALYRAAGFCEIGRRRHYYRNPTEDALLFALHLTPDGQKGETDEDSGS